MSLQTYNGRLVDVRCAVFDNPGEWSGAPYGYSDVWDIYPPDNLPPIGPFLEEEVALSVAADYFAWPTCEHGEDPAGCELCARDERDVRRFEQEHDEGVRR